MKLRANPPEPDPEWFPDWLLVCLAILIVLGAFVYWMELA